MKNLQASKGKARALALAWMMVAAMMAATAALPAASANDSCTDHDEWGSDDMSCDFNCEDGEVVSVSADGSGAVDGSAECGGSSAGCVGWKECNASSIEVGSGGDGDCSGNGEDGTLICSSSPSGTKVDLTTLVDIVQRVLDREVECPDFQSYAASAGFTSVVAKEFDEAGRVTGSFAWDLDVPCEDRLPPLGPGIPDYVQHLIDEVEEALSPN